MKAWILAAALAQAGDLATTAINLHRGCEEMVWPRPAMTLPLKGVGVVIVLTHLPLKGRPTLSKSLAGILMSSGTFGTIWNLAQSCQ